MAKKRIYLLDDSMKAAKSGYFIEGTDIQQDIPAEYPLPTETRIIKHGEPIDLRWLPTSNIINRREQIDLKFPEKYEWNELARKKLTFIYGRLELDEEKDKGAILYVEEAGWMAGNEDVKMDQNHRTIYFKYDPEQALDADNKFDLEVANAISLLSSLKEPQIRNLFLLSSNIASVDASVTLRFMKRQLIDIAKTTPDFIAEKITDIVSQVQLTVAKAVDYKIIDLEVSGMVGLQSPTDPTDYNGFVEMSDAGGSTAKMERLVQWLMLDGSQAQLDIINSMITKHEESLVK